MRDPACPHLSAIRSLRKFFKGWTQKRGGVFVEIDSGIGVLAQNGCRCHGLIGPSKQAFTAWALRGPGTTARISVALRIWRADMEMACFGTCEMSANHASPTC